MFELFLNAVKVVLSKDAREAASALVEVIRRLPDWKQDICVIDADVAQKDSEQATFLSALVLEKLGALNFDADAIRAFATCFSELSNNAFQHGCVRPSDTVRLRLEVTPQYVALSIQNARKFPSSLEVLLRRSRERLAADADRKRGRGLVTVVQQSDRFVQIDKRQIKAVVFSQRVRFRFSKFSDLVVIQTIRGWRNPSLPRRMVELANDCKGLPLLIDFRPCLPRPDDEIPANHSPMDSDFASLILDISERIKDESAGEPPMGIKRPKSNETSNDNDFNIERDDAPRRAISRLKGRVVTLLRPGYRLQLRADLQAYSIDEALKKLNVRKTPKVVEFLHNK